MIRFLFYQLLFFYRISIYLPLLERYRTQKKVITLFSRFVKKLKVAGENLTAPKVQRVSLSQQLIYFQEAED